MSTLDGNCFTFQQHLRWHMVLVNECPQTPGVQQESDRSLSFLQFSPVGVTSYLHLSLLFPLHNMALQGQLEE